MRQNFVAIRQNHADFDICFAGFRQREADRGKILPMAATFCRYTAKGEPISTSVLSISTKWMSIEAKFCRFVQNGCRFPHRSCRFPQNGCRLRQIFVDRGKILPMPVKSMAIFTK
ncbi:MAG: hypothetical protein NT166_18450 [Candidatus Aminicenantes bacterium]|nr:hypothetical protein [Candidatus Aminicenantes bacterium]